MINDYAKIDPIQGKSNERRAMKKEKDKLEALSARLIPVGEAAELMKIKKGTITPIAKNIKNPQPN